MRTWPTGEQCHGRCWGAGEPLMDRCHVKGHCAQNKGTSGGLPLPPGNTPTGSCPQRPSEAAGPPPWLATFYVRPEPCSLSGVGVQTAGTEETLGSLLLTLQAAGEHWELLTEAWDTPGCLTSDLRGSKTRSPRPATLARKVPKIMLSPDNPPQISAKQPLCVGL